MLKNRRWLWLPLLALVPLSSAQAGTSGGIREGRDQGHDIHISVPPGTPLGSATGTAWGALGTVRLEPLPDPDDPNANTYQDKAIGCYLDAAVGAQGSSVFIRCEATAPNSWLFCVSGEPAFVAAVAGMNSDSEITFTALGGTCTHLRVDNNSMYQQKAN